MAPATKRRRVATTTSFEPVRGVAVVAPAAAAISSYGRISKIAGLTAKDGANAKKQQQQQLCDIDLNIISNLNKGNINGPSNLKRKAGSEDLAKPHRKAFKSETAMIKMEEEEEEENSPPALDRLSLPTINVTDVEQAGTPTTSARVKLEQFSLQSSPLSQRRSSAIKSVKQESVQSSSSPAVPSPCPRKRRRGGDEVQLPAAVQDVVDMHSAFLTALSLHYAHHGTATPVDLKQLGSSISKVWGRRAISVQDVRRLLGVQQRAVGDVARAALLSVWDYGKGKTCIEYCSPTVPLALGSNVKEEDVKGSQSSSAKQAWNAGIARRPLESDALAKSFLAYVHEHHAAFLRNEGDNAGPEEFVESLPLARLHRRATSRAAKSTLLSKGQTRLTELKSGAITRQAKDASKDGNAAAMHSSSVSSTTQKQQTQSAYTPPSQRSTSLLSRIRAKESLLASQQSGPTAEQLARRAALHRLPDMVGVLTVLASNSTNAASTGAGGRSGIIPSNNGPLTHRMSSVNLGSDDDALLAALGGSGLPRAGSFSSTSSTRGLSGMFGSSPPALSPMSTSTSSSSSLSTGHGQTSSLSLSMKQVIERIQNSMRTPVSPAEVERVLRLLAEEVASEWIQIREVGSVKGVMIRGSAGPAKGWREKVESLVQTS